MHRLHKMVTGVLLTVVFSSGMMTFMPAAEAQTPNNKSVLVLLSYHFDNKWETEVFEGIKPVFAGKNQHRLVFEYLDTKNNSGNEYERSLSAFFDTKYKHQSFDLLLCVNDFALKFALKKRQSLFPDATIVFCGVNSLEYYNLSNYKNITGIVEQPDHQSFVDNLLRLHPNVSTVYIYYFDVPSENSVRIQKTLFEDKMKVVELSNLSLSEFSEHIESVPSDSLVMLGGIPPEMNNSPPEAHFNIKNCKAPVYANWIDIKVWEMNALRGIAGANVISGITHGNIAATIAKRILDGEHAGSIQIVNHSPNILAFNHPVIKKFGIDESDLPGNSQISYKIQPFLQYYRYHIFAVMMIIIVFLTVFGIRHHLRLRKVVSQLLEYEKKIRTSNSELESFSYSVSHDLRSPIQAVIGFAEILAMDYQDKLDSEGQLYLKKIRSSGLRMSNMIKSLLEISRIAQDELFREPVDLKKIAFSIFQEIQYNDAHDSIITYDEPLTAYADIKLIDVVMQNLLQNAWKFSSKRQQIQIHVGKTTRNGKTAFFVRDNGVGIDMEKSGKLFQPFQRLHSDQEFEGTGIGLATVKRIISRHGGEIWVESEVEKGTTFFFTLG